MYMYMCVIVHVHVRFPFFVFFRCLQPILVGFVTKGSPRVAKLSLRCLNKVYSETDLLVDRTLKVSLEK